MVFLKCVKVKNAKKYVEIDEKTDMETVTNDVAATALSEFVTDLLMSEIDKNALPVFLESNHFGIGTVQR